MKYLFVLLVAMSASIATANEIYIEQVGDTLDLDIVQDGKDNTIGTSSQDVVLGSATVDADDMTFSITQTGDNNAITAQILGATYTGTWVFTGDSNEVDLLCDSGEAGTCANVTLNITATGDDQDYTINVGESADADGLTAAFTVTDDGTVITADVDGEDANITVTVNSNSSVVEDVNTIDIDIAGDGDVNGHTQIISVKGKGNTVSVDQSGIYDNKVDLDLTGDSGNVDITQSD